MSQSIEALHSIAAVDAAKHFVVVGAGGTGGVVIRDLARAMGIQNSLRVSMNQNPHTLTIIEADDVELKNLTRQNFIKSDLGKNKGIVLAKRYGNSFGISISVISQYLDPANRDEIIDSIASKYNSGSGDQFVLVDCVDNNKTRYILGEIQRELSYASDCYYISSGNEEYTGQVICGYMPHSYIENILDRELILVENLNDSLVTEPVQDFYLPNILDYFPDLEIDKLPNEMSCAEASVSAPQNIITNQTAGNLVFSFLNKILTKEPISQLAIFFNMKNTNFKTYHFQKTQLAELFKMSENNYKAYSTFINPVSSGIFDKTEGKALKERFKESIRRPLKMKVAVTPVEATSADNDSSQSDESVFPL